MANHKDVTPEELAIIGKYSQYDLSTNQVRVLVLFQTQPRLNSTQIAEQFEEQFGRISFQTSPSTYVSQLTQKGFLRNVGEELNVQTGKQIGVWERVDGEIVELPELNGKAPKQTAHQAKAEITLLLARNKNLEETNLKLMGLIETLREEVDNLHEKAAGVDL